MARQVNSFYYSSFVLIQNLCLKYILIKLLASIIVICQPFGGIVSGFLTGKLFFLPTENIIYRGFSLGDVAQILFNKV